jgi:hypothetical protein
MAKQLTTAQLVDLRAKAMKAQAIAPGVWENDTRRLDGASPDFLYYVLTCDPARDGQDQRVILGSENGDLVQLERDMHPDEDGGYGLDWDEHGRQLTDYMAASQPATVIALVDEVKALREEAATLRQRNRDLLRANTTSHDRIVGLRACLESIHNGRIVPKQGEGHSYTELEDWPPGEASGMAGEALKRLPPGQSYQQRVLPWHQTCFSAEVWLDIVERGDRLLEEVLELLQSNGYDPARVPMIHRYVFNRPVGETFQEVGGVMVCLAAYCNAAQVDMQHAAETELARIWTKVDQIRAKQLTKPKGSPLPVPADMADLGTKTSLMSIQHKGPEHRDLEATLPIAPGEERVISVRYSVADQTLRIDEYRR